jgi:antirestriction protein ArdC
MEKNDVYQLVTDRICELLEKGVVPWQRPWKSSEALPKNLLSKREYRGLNVFLLNSLCYPSPYFLTFKQAQEMGAHIRKGEKSCPVIFWKWLEKENAETGEIEEIPFLRYYSVFNVAQCDGLPADKIPIAETPERPFNVISTAQAIVANMPRKPAIQHRETRAYYRPSADLVNMPQPGLFNSDEGYYATLFHELVHSTGHQSRLNRSGVTELNNFGSHSYSKEELCAEMGAAFLCSHAGIIERTLENSAAYIDGWLQRLCDDRKLVVLAAAQAQKASDFILDRSFTSES